METTVDLRGLVCPEPVLRAKKLLDDGSLQKLEALVESEVNVNNLQRLARSLKLQFESQSENNFFRVTLQRRGQEQSNSAPGSHSGTGEAGSGGLPSSGTSVSSAPVSASEARSGERQANEAVATSVGTVVFLSKDKFGDGDQEFSNTLLNMFLQTMLQSGHRPRAILMANTGVKLMAKDSATLKVLQDFQEDGVEVLACGLCVDYYGLKGQIPVQQITNMFAICEFLMVADKVIQP